jgi:4-hydroxymandelate oxidase
MELPESPAQVSPPSTSSSLEPSASPESALAGALSVGELEPLAQGRLTSLAYDYYASGADDEHTLRRNVEAYRELALHYRVLVDVSRPSTATTVLGTPVASPILVAPTAFHRLAHPDGEVASARAAAEAGTIFTLSTLSTTRIEDVRASSSGPLWFQLYVYKDRAATADLVARVEAAGASALVLTVDAPRLGRRERDVRNRFALPPELRVENLHGRRGTVAPPPEGSGLATYFYQLVDPALCWDDLAWLRGLTRLPLIVKGLVRADDAARAVAAGVDGIVVSNHGGRQLDTAPATIEVLPRIAEAVDGRAEVLLDGGVRRGTDVVKALALGARAVMVGRPVLWGLAVGGQAGVAAVLAMLRRELEQAMVLCGAPTVRDLTPDLVDPDRGDPERAGRPHRLRR